MGTRLYATRVTSCVVEPTNLFPIHMQAQRLHVPVYIAGFVVGTAPLCMTLLSPIIGYFVSTLAVVELSAALLYQSQIFHNFTYTAASSAGTKVRTACWTVLSWRLPDSFWVLNTIVVSVSKLCVT